MQNSSASQFFLANNGRVLSPLIAQTSALPDATTFGQGVYNMAWPQILAWCSAVAGVLLVSLIVKSFLSRG